jgi:hypothetical protein
VVATRIVDIVDAFIDAAVKLNVGLCKCAGAGQRAQR